VPGYLLDTNILSETRKRRPNPAVLDFLAAAEDRELFVSVLTLGELRKGVELKRESDAEAANQLEAWLGGIEAHFQDRVLSIDASVALLWGKLSAKKSSPVIDTLIAATALVRDLTLVTRNVRDVAWSGVELINPWQA
jgi:toxin FitB